METITFDTVTTKNVQVIRGQEVTVTHKPIDKDAESTTSSIKTTGTVIGLSLDLGSLLIRNTDMSITNIPVKNIVVISTNADSSTETDSEE